VFEKFSNKFSNILYVCNLCKKLERTDALVVIYVKIEK